MLHPGDEITPHTDHPSYGDVIATVQLRGRAKVTISRGRDSIGGKVIGSTTLELDAGDACVSL